MQKIALILAKWGIPFFTLLIVVATALSSEIFVAANAARPTLGPKSCTLVNDGSGNTTITQGDSVTGLTIKDDKGDSSLSDFKLDCTRGSRNSSNDGGFNSTNVTPCSSEKQINLQSGNAGQVEPFCQKLNGTVTGNHQCSSMNNDTLMQVGSTSFRFNTSSPKDDRCTAVVWDLSATNAPQGTCTFTFNAEGQILHLNFEMASGNTQIPPYTASKQSNVLTDSSASKNSLLTGVQKIFLDTTTLPNTTLTIDSMLFSCGPKN
ncbi:MAG TPA: hypothetical protein VGL94_17350 [Ktedonobacteraceae bacterium]|jgi:hypothetical protein